MEEDALIPNTASSADPWITLREFTAARIALGRTGISEPLVHSLQFKLAHAHARDAVYSELNYLGLAQKITEKFNLPVYHLQSQVCNRQEYLQRPDLGRKLNETSTHQLIDGYGKNSEIAIILSDGLSATAINDHALPLLEVLVPALQKASITLAPITLVEQGRVAISDEIGYLLKAQLSLILIGERPGLSSPDSMGAYFTFNPAPGLTDESRNCLSNIRSAGLTYPEAAAKLIFLIQESLRLKISGVHLKDQANFLE